MYKQSGAINENFLLQPYNSLFQGATDLGDWYPCAALSSANWF